LISTSKAMRGVVLKGYRSLLSVGISCPAPVHIYHGIDSEGLHMVEQGDKMGLRRGKKPKSRFDRIVNKIPLFREFSSRMKQLEKL